MLVLLLANSASVAWFDADDDALSVAWDAAASGVNEYTTFLAGGKDSVRG